MNNPLVSIIVPCYNYAHYLGLTLENIRTQEYQHWECLIIDDGSTDDTSSVAALFVKADGRFRYLHQSNRGLSAARNYGLAESRGVYIQFLDSDDFIHSAKIAKQVAILEADKEIDITYGKSFFFFDDNLSELYPTRKKSGASPKKNLQVNGRGKAVLGKLLINNIMEVSCALLKKELTKKVGFFDESFKSWGAEDIDLAYRLHVNGTRFVLGRTAKSIHYPHHKSYQTNMSDAKKNYQYFSKKYEKRVCSLVPDNHFFRINDIILNNPEYYIKQSQDGYQYL